MIFTTQTSSIDYNKLLQQLQSKPGWMEIVFGALAIGIVLSVAIVFVMKRHGIIKVGNGGGESTRANGNGGKIDINSLKDFMRDQHAMSRKVLYDIKQAQELNHAITKNTLEHFSKAVDKMMDSFGEMKEDVSKMLDSMRTKK